MRNRGHPHDQTLHDSTGEIGLNLPNTKLHGRDFSVPKFLEKKLGSVWNRDLHYFFGRFTVDTIAIVTDKSTMNERRERGSTGSYIASRVLRTLDRESI